MQRRELLQPPHIIEAGGPIIFLAGPIQDAPDWQAEAFETIKQLDDGITVASPRKDYAPGEFVYELQVDWETYFLHRAAKHGAILFWLANQVSETKAENGFMRPYAQTTRQELAEWRTHKIYNPDVNLVVGVEPGFTNARYTRRRFEQVAPDVPILSSLGETCAKAVGLVRA